MFFAFNSVLFFCFVYFLLRRLPRPLFHFFKIIESIEDGFEVDSIESSTVYVRALLGLANIYFDCCEYDQCQQHLQKAVALNQTQGHRDARSDCMRLQAKYLEAQGVFRSALNVHMEILRSREELFGPRHPSVAETMNDIASLRLRLSDISVVSLIDDGLAMLLDFFPPKHPTVAESLFTKAQLHLAKAEYTDAYCLMKATLDIRTQAYGEKHPLVADSLQGLGSINLAIGNFGDAERELRLAHKQRKQLFEGSVHSKIADSLSSIAQLTQAKGAYSDAIPIYEKTLALRMANTQNLKVDAHADVEITKLHLGNVHSLLCRFDKAKILLSK